MKLVIVSQWVPCRPGPAGSSTRPKPAGRPVGTPACVGVIRGAKPGEPRMQAALWSPEMWIVVGEVKPTPCSGRKAAALSASGGAEGAPPGSETGACIYRGDLGTRETQYSPRRSRKWGTGLKNPQARQPEAIRPCRERIKGMAERYRPARDDRSLPGWGAGSLSGA